MQKIIWTLLLAAAAGGSPVFADLVEVGPITLGNSWTQSFVMGNHASGSKWSRAEITMQSGPGFETAADLRDQTWETALVNSARVVITGPDRLKDLQFSLTFNGLPGPVQFIAFQFDGNQLLRKETSVITYDHGWHIRPDDSANPVPEPAPLLLIGSSLMAAAALMRRRLAL